MRRGAASAAPGTRNRSLIRIIDASGRRSPSQIGSASQFLLSHRARATRDACREHGSTSSRRVEQHSDRRAAANRVTPIRSIRDRIRVPKTGFRGVDEKNFSRRKATRDLTSQAPKLRARIEMSCAKRGDFVFTRTQVILILSRQMRCRVLRVQIGATAFAMAMRRARMLSRSCVEAFAVHATSTRFVKWSRCFVHSVVIEASCGRFATARFR